VHAQFGRVVTALEAKLPAAAAHLSAAETDLLAFTAGPREIWRQVWSSARKNASIKNCAAEPTSSASSPTEPPSSP
jgi:transposase-like protein